MRKLGFGLTILMIAAIMPCHAQTLDDLAAKYGASNMFRVSPRVLMSPIYNGKTLCGASFQTNHLIDGHTTWLDNGIDPEELLQAIDGLAPEKRDSLPGQTSGYQVHGSNMVA